MKLIEAIEQLTEGCCPINESNYLSLKLIVKEYTLTKKRLAR